MLDLYTGCDYSLIEVSLQTWPFTVLYMDQIYDDIKGNYIFPEKEIQKYQMSTKTVTQPTDREFFEEIYKMN